MTQLSDISFSQWMVTPESCVGNLQDFDNVMATQTMEDGHQEDHSKQIPTKKYVFSRLIQLIGEALSPIYVNAMEGVMTQPLQENPINQELGSFLNQMIKKDNKGIKLVDIESKYSLHKLHHKTNLTRQVFSAVTALLLTAGVV